MAEVEVSSNGASELESKKVPNEENTAQEEAPDTEKEEAPVQLNGESDHKETEIGQGELLITKKVKLNLKVESQIVEYFL